MVYFWKRQHRSPPTSTSPSSSSHLLSPQHELPPPAAAALSTFSLAVRQSSGHTTSRPRDITSSSSSSSGGGSCRQVHGISSANMLDKLSENSRRKYETERRRVAERELDNLNLKIDKLLLRMDDTDTRNRRKSGCDEECVVCLAAPATMQTFPCGHKVVCRKCLIKTIQVAVSQRCLPLRCVVCRDRILRLHHTNHNHSSSYAATIQPSPSLPSSLMSPSSHSSRSESSPLTPTTIFSHFPGFRYRSTFSRTLPTPETNAHSLAPSSCSDSKVPEASITQEAEIFPYLVEDGEACANLHNDDVNFCRSSTMQNFGIIVPIECRTSASNKCRAGTSRDHGVTEERISTSQNHTVSMLQEGGVSTSEESGVATSPEGGMPTSKEHGVLIERMSKSQKHEVCTESVTTPQKRGMPVESVTTSLKRGAPIESVTTSLKHRIMTAQENRNTAAEESRVLHKHKGRLPVSIAKKSESPSHSFRHSQSVKIHPTTTDQLTTFMHSPSGQGAASIVPPGVESSNNQSKPVRTNSFLSKFLPKRARRKCNWF